MDINSELMTILIAASPILELRGAIPFAVAKGVSFPRLFFLAILGNILPVIPLFLFLKYSVQKVRKIRVLDRFFSWWFANVRSRSGMIEKYGFWGLILFVAIPFPVTGAWTGTVASVLFGFRLSRAFIAISVGVVVAAVLVSCAVNGVVSFSNYNGFLIK